MQYVRICYMFTFQQPRKREKYEEDVVWEREFLAGARTRHIILFELCNIFRFIFSLMFADDRRYVESSRLARNFMDKNNIKDILSHMKIYT